MKINNIFLTVLFSFFAGISFAQSASFSMIESFHPSTVRNVYEITKYIPLSESKQIALAKLIEEEDTYFAKCLKEELVISQKTKNMLTRLRKENMQKVLSEKELDQYYRGISDAGAENMAAQVRDWMKVQLGTSYQEGKFIYASFYKIFLESKVAEIKFADKPKIMESKVKQIREDELKILVEKCGISIDDSLTAKRVWRFKPNTPLR